MLRTERLVAITLLVQARGKMTAERLAGIMGVSVRTIYRDMDTLSLAHVPVTMDKGPGGGYYLPENYRLDPTTFTSEEAVALALGGSIADGYQIFESGDGLRRALVKLEASLPAEYRADVRAARERLLFDTSRWHRRVEVGPGEHLETLRAALWSARQIHLLYQKPGQEDGELRPRRVEPLGLVCKAGVWYLVAYCHTRRDVRTFRVDRVLAVAVREEAVRPRPGFNLGAYWEAAKQRFESELPSLTVTMRVGAAARRSLSAATVVQEDGDGAAVVQVSFPYRDAAVAYALARGPEVVVLDPPEVREGIVDAARSLLTTYLAPNAARSATPGAPPGG
jgi:predicted DNA-binding transcriptional regulator YafY